jgi:dipeptidyl aminopeptidase/acylaminoacyl peptidase
VNYGGSSGYGRAYIGRLAGNWGVVDVEDCIHAAGTLSSAPYSLIDPARVVIRGGSAGGFTTLAALTIASDVTTFAAGTSSFGVSDLRKLAEDTHKFESRYLEKLVGGTVEEVPEVFKDRSPVFHADKIVSPLLVS